MMRQRSSKFARVSQWLVVVLVLAVAGPAVADHYSETRRAVRRRDQVVLDSLRRLTHTEFFSVTVDPFLCACLEPTCEEDFMLGCGGEVLPENSGFLSSARRTSRETCYVCGCAWAEPIELRATPVCAGF